MTADNYNRIKTYRVSFAGNISYFVFNHSFTNAVLIRILISPDGKIWMNDGLEIEVSPRELITLVPNYFGKYATLEYKSKSRCREARLDIWFQMTRPPAKQCFGVGNDPS